MRYLVINPEGYVINIIIWDGVSRYNPRQNTLLVEDDAPKGVSFGWKLVDGQWIAPPQEEIVETNGTE